MPWRDKYLNKVVCGDCVTLLPEFPDKSISIIFTDPPYGVNYKSSSDSVYMPGDSINLLPVVLPEFYRILKDDGAVYIFASTSNLYQYLVSFQTYFKLHNIIIWDKELPIYPYSKAHYRLQYEPILYGSKGLFYLKNSKPGDVIKAGIVRGNTRQHPTQKPVDLIEKILEPIAAGGIVFDPFVGSGAIPLAAKKLNLDFIGIDINPDYCEIARKRLAQEVLL